ncbi:hypothetical protein QJQ45_017232, partial [Haematococcus lacustris]
CLFVLVIQDGVVGRYTWIPGRRGDMASSIRFDIIDEGDGFAQLHAYHPEVLSASDIEMLIERHDDHSGLSVILETRDRGAGQDGGSALLGSIELPGYDVPAGESAKYKSAKRRYSLRLRQLQPRPAPQATSSSAAVAAGSGALLPDDDVEDTFHDARSDVTGSFDGIDANGPVAPDSPGGRPVPTTQPPQPPQPSSESPNTPATVPLEPGLPVPSLAQQPSLPEGAEGLTKNQLKKLQKKQRKAAGTGDDATKLPGANEQGPSAPAPALPTPSPSPLSGDRPGPSLSLAAAPAGPPPSPRQQTQPSSTVEAAPALPAKGRGTKPAQGEVSQQPVANGSGGRSGAGLPHADGSPGAGAGQGDAVAHVVDGACAPGGGVTPTPEQQEKKASSPASPTVPAPGLEPGSGPGPGPEGSVPKAQGSSPAKGGSKGGNTTSTHPAPHMPVVLDMDKEFASEPLATTQLAASKPEKGDVTWSMTHGPYVISQLNKVDSKGEDRSLDSEGHSWHLHQLQAATTFSAYGIFDGHGGRAPGVYASKHLLPLVCGFLDRAVGPEPSLPPSLAESGVDDGDARVWAVQDAMIERLPKALHAGFRAADAECQRRFKEGGTTATLALLVGWELVVATVGDSCAYLDTGGMIIQVSGNHRVENAPEEQERVMAAGGIIARSSVKADEQEDEVG